MEKLNLRTFEMEMKEKSNYIKCLCGYGTIMDEQDVGKIT